MNGKDLDNLKPEYCTAPAGMTIDESDNKVIDVWKFFGNNPNISYIVIPSKLTGQVIATQDLNNIIKIRCI